MVIQNPLLPHCMVNSTTLIHMPFMTSFINKSSHQFASQISHFNISRQILFLKELNFHQINQKKWHKPSMVNVEINVFQLNHANPSNNIS